MAEKSARRLRQDKERQRDQLRAQGIDPIAREQSQLAAPARTRVQDRIDRATQASFPCTHGVPWRACTTCAPATRR